MAAPFMESDEDKSMEPVGQQGDKVMQKKRRAAKKEGAGCAGEAGEACHEKEGELSPQARPAPCEEGRGKGGPEDVCGV